MVKDHKHIVTNVAKKAFCDDHAHIFKSASVFVDVKLPDDDQPKDTVKHPNHYQPLFVMRPLECFEICGLMGYTFGNVIKYVWRAGEKANDTDGLDKACQYLSMPIYQPNCADAFVAKTLANLMIATTPVEVAKLAVIRAVCNQETIPEIIKKIRDVRALLAPVSKNTDKKPRRDKHGRFTKGGK